MDIGEAALVAEDRRVAALLAADTVTIGALFDDRVRYVHANGLLDTKASYLSSMARGDLTYLTIDISDRSVTEHDDLVVVVFRMRTDITYHGEPRTLDNICTTVWSGTSPRLISFQATPKLV